MNNNSCLLQRLALKTQKFSFTTMGFSNSVPKSSEKKLHLLFSLFMSTLYSSQFSKGPSFYTKSIEVTHIKQMRLTAQSCKITVLFTLFKSPMWNPANSLTFISDSLSGDSPVIPCSSCLKSLLCTKERPLEWFFTFIPISCGTFLPTEPIIRSDSIFV